MMGFGIGVMLWMVLGSLLFIVLAVLVIWFLIRWLGQRTSTRQTFPPGQVPSSQPEQEYEQPRAQYQREEESPWQR